MLLLSIPISVNQCAFTGKKKKKNLTKYDESILLHKNGVHGYILTPCSIKKKGHLFLDAYKFKLLVNKGVRHVVCVTLFDQRIFCLNHNSTARSVEKEVDLFDIIDFYYDLYSIFGN